MESRQTGAAACPNGAGDPSDPARIPSDPAPGGPGDPAAGPGRGPRPGRLAFPLAALAAAAFGCSAEWYQRSADDDVYPIVRRERKAVIGEERDFRVEQVPIAVGAVGKAGETEDLRRTPAPKPGELQRSSPGGLAPDAQSPASPSPAPTPAPVAPPPAGTPSPAPAPPPPSPPAGAAAPQATPAPPAPSPPPPAGASPSQAAEPPRTEAAPSAPASDPAVAAARAPTVPARILTIPAALQLAFANNREYQTARESVYLTALRLTLEQHQFAPRFFGIIAGDWNHDSAGEESGSLTSNFGMDLLLANGTRLSISLLNNFFQFFTGDRREVAATLINGAVTQPLLRGFGTEVVREPLTQAERDVVYEVRAFERFRRTFGVTVVSEFYRVLQVRDRVTNEYANWQSLVVNRDRVETLANAQRLPRFEVDQARQQELEAEDRWVAAVEQYESALDRFKITLGISTGEGIALDQEELAKLAAQPVDAPQVTVEEAVRAALALRLDLMTSQDEVEDTERRILVAADGLEAQLDLTAAGALQSGTGGDQKPLKFNSNNFAYGFGFDVDLPLDRKAERNAYVATLIAHERSKRDYTLLEDSIRLTIRDAHRALEREVVTYRIQRASLELAEQRVASTWALLQAGRVQTRDVLDSQTSLNSARNAVTTSLTNYAIARLDFLRDTETLRVTEGGEVTALPMEEMLND